MMDEQLMRLLEVKEKECKELKAKIKYMEEYIKQLEIQRNEFEKKKAIF